MGCGEVSSRCSIMSAPWAAAPEHGVAWSAAPIIVLLGNVIRRAQSHFHVEFHIAERLFSDQLINWKGRLEPTSRRGVAGVGSNSFILVARLDFSRPDDPAIASF